MHIDESINFTKAELNSYSMKGAEETALRKPLKSPKPNTVLVLKILAKFPFKHQHLIKYSLLITPSRLRLFGIGL